MSLLLDALKKAAQKKAKKSDAPNESVESTEIVDHEKTVASTQYNETGKDFVVSDAESTQVISGTKISDTMEIAAVAVNKKGKIETEINETADDSTQVDQHTHFLEATEIDATSIEQTEMNEKPVDFDSTLLEQNTQLLDATEVDSTSIDKTEFFNQFDENSNFEVELDNDKTKVGEEEVKLSDKTEFDNTALNANDIQNRSALEDESERVQEIEPLSIPHDVEPLLNETNSNSADALIDTDALYQTIINDEADSLTEDDVTQFMGDGISSPVKYDAGEGFQVSKIGADDTTITSPEYLDLTNFSFTNENSADTVTAQSTSIPDNSLRQHDGAGEIDEIRAVSKGHQQISEDEKKTVLNTEESSTVSSVDIEKLTNDETVTVGSSSATKTFAPDNYDRTLLNLSDKDVSRIFPGMRPDSDTVMTPDYAKRIFISKSSQVKSRYFKVYAGIAIMSLLLVIMWGLFQFQEESDRVDQNLMSLKRDPMPGIIKPQTEKVTKGLFENQSNQSDLKTVDLLSTAGESDEDVSSRTEIESNVITLKEEVDEIVEASSVEGSLRVEQTISGNISSLASNSIDSNRPVQSQAVSTSELVISSSSQVSQKNQLLMEAYQAYEQGNSTTAKELYNELLSMDESNRDGLLGRAALHVRDDEYQQAFDMYQRLLLSNPKDSMAMAALISVASIDPKSAETQLKSLLREQPKAPYLHFVLGNIYGGQNRWSEAQSAYFDALQKKPDDPNYAYNLAVSLEHIGKADTAVTYYQRALKNSSNGLVTFDEQLVMQRLEVLSQ